MHINIKMWICIFSRHQVIIKTIFKNSKTDTSMNVEQRYVISFLIKKGFKGSQIIKELEEVYGNDSLSKTQVYFWISEIRGGRKDLQNIESPGRPLQENVSEKILYWLDIEPYASVQRLAHLCGHHPFTIKTRLIEHLGYKKYYLRWVPHMLTSDMKKKRVTYFKQMLEALLKFQKEGYHHIITGDESWFYLRYFHRFIYAQSREKVENIPKRLISEPKFMFTIFWNPWCFFIINVLPPSQKFNSEYFINQILKPLGEKLYPNGRKKYSKKYSLHFDNAKPHTSLKTKNFISNSELSQLPHPPYSPDIAPIDFYLFGKLKTDLKGHNFENEIQLFEYITEYVGNIDHDELMAVFDEWINRLQEVISTGGEYITK